MSNSISGTETCLTCGATITSGNLSAALTAYGWTQSGGKWRCSTCARENTETPAPPAVQTPQPQTQTQASIDEAVAEKLEEVIEEIRATHHHEASAEPTE